MVATTDKKGSGKSGCCVRSTHSGDKRKGGSAQAVVGERSRAPPKVAAKLVRNPLLRPKATANKTRVFGDDDRGSIVVARKTLRKMEANDINYCYADDSD